MFGNFSDKIKSTLDGIRKQAHITEDNIKPVLQELRLTLLEADTALPVVKSIIENLQEKALGMQVQKSLNPSQMFISLVHREIVDILGGEQEILNLRVQPPAVIMLVGLQGAGKTTNLVKSALWLRKMRKKKVLLTSLDISRPAAAEQLAVLAKQAELDYYDGAQRTNILELAKDVLQQAQLGGYDCLLVDTAGRVQTDKETMEELKLIHSTITPAEVLYTMDAMGGQDAARAATAFSEAVPISGIIATKLDSAARGGAILSVKYLTGKPIKLLSSGEKLTDIMDFNPSAMAESIMGMGNAMAVIKQAEMTIDEKDADGLAQSAKGKSKFDFNAFLLQLQQMQKMGGMASMATKMGLSKEMAQIVEQKQMDPQTKKFIGLIHSMTPKERKFPEVLSGSRKMRISKGAGSNMAEINQMLKRYKQVQKMMQKTRTAAGKQKFMNQLMPSAGPSPFGPS